MNINKMLQVARWEFIEKVRTKAFIIGIFITPLLMGVFGTLPSILASKSDSKTKVVAVLDETNSLITETQTFLNSKYTLDNGQPNYRLEAIPAGTTLEQVQATYYSRVFSDELIGILIIPANVAETRTLEMRSENAGNIRDVNNIERGFQKVLIQHSAAQNGIQQAVFEKVSKPLDTKQVKISKKGTTEETGFIQTFGMAYGSVILSFILILGTAQMLVRGLLDEKNNRIMEILISSCSPFELMMGKLLGLSGLGMVQAGSMVVFGIGAMIYFKIPLSGLANFPLVITYTLLGYLLFASIFLGLGALTTTEQEAQQITGYITMLAVLPVTFILPIMQNPNGTIARVLSFIPFTAPTAMSMRISIQMPALWEMLASLVSIIAAVVIIIFFMSKIFRAAILSYGKRPTLPEIIGFLKDPM
jgi:ABC-2 type transport system permease protein